MEYSSPGLQILYDFVHRDALESLILSGGTDTDLPLCRSLDEINQKRQTLENFQEQFKDDNIMLGEIQFPSHFTTLCEIIKAAKVNTLVLHLLSLDEEKGQFLIEAISENKSLTRVELWKCNQVLLQNPETKEKLGVDYCTPAPRVRTSSREDNLGHKYLADILTIGAILLVGSGLYYASMPIVALGALSLLLGIAQYCHENSTQISGPSLRR